MRTIQQAVEISVSNKPFLSELIGEDLLNFSALARKIKPEIENYLVKEVQEGAIVAALRRLPLSLKQRSGTKLQKVLGSLGSIIVRSNLSDYTFQNSQLLIGKQEELLKRISERNDIFYAFSQGVFETTIVLSDILKNDVENIFASEVLLSQTKNLAAITLRLPTENTEMPGLYYYIFEKLAWQGINVKEVVSTTNEITILVMESIINEAFGVIKSLKEPFKRF